MDKLIEELRKNRLPVIDKCKNYEGKTCGRIDGDFCHACFNPAAKWRLGNCNLATHIITRVSENKGKVRVGQQKQKSRK